MAKEIIPRGENVALNPLADMSEAIGVLEEQLTMEKPDSPRYQLLVGQLDGLRGKLTDYSIQNQNSNFNI